MKDKEWVKKEIKKLKNTEMISSWVYRDLLMMINRLPDEREQLEIAYEDMLKRKEFEFDGKEYVVVGKPEIPQFVADFVEKVDVYTLFDVFIEEWLYKYHEDVAEWLYDDTDEENEKREFELVVAMRYGYTVKREPKYYAKVKGNPPLMGIDYYAHLTTLGRTDGYFEPVRKEHGSTYAKTEWNRLGLDDTNADFERVKEP